MDRKRTIVLAGALLVMGAAVAAASPTAADTDVSPQPQAVVDQLIADLGEVTRGKTVEHDFVIRNEGAAPLEITDVRPTCGCTVADYDKVIPPGGSGNVHAKLNTSGLRGALNKSIGVFTNDPENPRLNLVMRVRISEYLIFNPGFARFVRGRGHDDGEVRQILYTPDFEELEITEVESPYPFVEVTYRPATEDEVRPEGNGNQWVFTVSLDYDAAPVGPLAGEVKVVTNHPEQPIVQLPVSGFVRPRVAVTPHEADFGEVALEEPFTARFLFHNFTPGEVKVTRVEPGIEGAEAKFEPIEEGKRYSLELTLKPEMAPGPFDGMMKVHTDDPELPLVEVHLWGEVLESEESGR